MHARHRQTHRRTPSAATSSARHASSSGCSAIPRRAAGVAAPPAMQICQRQRWVHSRVPVLWVGVSSRRYGAHARCASRGAPGLATFPRSAPILPTQIRTSAAVRADTPVVWLQPQTTAAPSARLHSNAVFPPQRLVMASQRRSPLDSLPQAAGLPARQPRH
eukprot:COSAG02_NODE_7081_length_3194_cov_2.330210_5_plen_162_part_00